MLHYNTVTPLLLKILADLMIALPYTKSASLYSRQSALIGKFSDFESAEGDF